MLRLNRYIIALVLWLSFLFNIERLDLNIGNPDISNIASPFYVTCALLVVMGVVLPQWKQLPLWRLQAVAALLFVATMLMTPPPYWGGMHTYVSMFELMAVLISVTLGGLVGRQSADFIEAARGLLFVDIDDRVYPAPQAGNVIKREMQFSRRANRPLTVMVLDTHVDGKQQSYQATVREIQQILAKRQSLVALTRLLPKTLRRTDFVVHENDDGRLVVVMPELQKEQATTIVRRLRAMAQRRLGLDVHVGLASFPEQGLTFEELVHQARLEVAPEVQTGSEVVVERREGINEKVHGGEVHQLAHADAVSSLSVSVES